MKDKQEKLDNVLSFFTGGGWVYWLTEKRGHLLMLIPVFLLGSFILFRTTQKGGSREADFVAADVAYRQWAQTTESADGHLETLKELVKKHPELEGRYDDLIVQGLIARNEFDHAVLTAMRALERSSNIVPYWADFGGTTLLIGKQEFKKALSEAERLKEEMLGDEQFFKDNECQNGAMLFSLNLMRIAFLHQKMDSPSEELMAWKQLKRFGGLEDEAPAAQREAVQKVIGHFTAQNISLLDYIRHREEACASLMRHR